MGPKKHVLDGVQIPQMERCIFRGCPPRGKASGVFAAVYEETAEPIEMPFGG